MFCSQVLARLCQGWRRSLLLGGSLLIAGSQFAVPMATVADDSSTTEVVTETASENKLTAEEQADGWLLLFDGETPFGWRPAGDANWSIGDGVVKVSDGEVCLFRTTSQYSDYILRADFRAPESTNSGIFLRTAPPVPPAS